MAVVTRGNLCGFSLLSVSLHTHTPRTLVAGLSTNNFFSHRQEVQKIYQEMLKCCASHLSPTGALHLFFLLCYLHMQIFQC